MLTLDDVHRHARRRRAPVALAWEGAPGRAQAAVETAQAEGLADATHARAGDLPESGALVAPLADAQRLAQAGPAVAALLLGDRLLLVGPYGEGGADARAAAARFAASLLARLGVEARLALVGDSDAGAAEASVRGLGLRTRAYGARVDEALPTSDVLLLPTSVLGELAVRLLEAAGAARLLAVLPASERRVVLLGAAADPVEGLALASALAP